MVYIYIYIYELIVVLSQWRYAKSSRWSESSVKRTSCPYDRISIRDKRHVFTLIRCIETWSMITNFLYCYQFDFVAVCSLARREYYSHHCLRAGRCLVPRHSAGSTIMLTPDCDAVLFLGTMLVFMSLLLPDALLAPKKSLIDSLYVQQFSIGCATILSERFVLAFHHVPMDFHWVGNDAHWLFDDSFFKKKGVMLIRSAHRNVWKHIKAYWNILSHI